MTVLDKGQLPESILSAWEASEKMKGSRMRAEQSEIVNQAIGRPSHGKTNVNGEHSYLMKSCEKSEVGWSKQWHEGIIFEEACTKLGGADSLRASVGRGQVKVSGAGDERYLMYHLPRSSIGGGWEFKMGQRMKDGNGSGEEGDARDEFMKEVQKALGSTPDFTKLLGSFESDERSSASSRGLQ